MVKFFRRRFQSTVITLLWSTLAVAWFGAIMYPVSNAHSGTLATIPNALSLVFAAVISFVFAHKWIGIIPSLCVYASLHYLILLLTDKAPQTWTVGWSIVIVTVAIITVWVMIRIGKSRLTVLDRVLLAWFSLSIFIPIAFESSIYLWVVVSFTPIAFIALRRLRLEGVRIKWSERSDE